VPGTRGTLPQGLITNSTAGETKARMSGVCWVSSEVLVRPKDNMAAASNMKPGARVMPRPRKWDCAIISGFRARQAVSMEMVGSFGNGGPFQRISTLRTSLEDSAF
jgi:hypothetical protein